MITGKSKVNNCIQILEGLYGVPEAEQIDPVDLLVATILSQNTTDKNSLKAFGNLKSSYPDYESLLSAPEALIEEKIRVGGLAEMKAKRIKAALEKIKADAGSIDLSFIRKMDLMEARDYLLFLPGVGPKTAAVVLLFAFHKSTMPVDTHVFRVSKRIGLVPEKANITKAQAVLENITPPDKYLSMHLNLIRHGRVICKARNPVHSDCALRDICYYYSHATRLK
jgi:endonuclease III